jgi:hypothetical protein
VKGKQMETTKKGTVINEHGFEFSEKTMFDFEFKYKKFGFDNVDQLDFENYEFYSLNYTKVYNLEFLELFKDDIDVEPYIHELAILIDDQKFPTYKGFYPPLDDLITTILHFDSIINDGELADILMSFSFSDKFIERNYDILDEFADEIVDFYFIDNPRNSSLPPKSERTDEFREQFISSISGYTIGRTRLKDAYRVYYKLKREKLSLSE